MDEIVQASIVQPDNIQEALITIDSEVIFEATLASGQRAPLWFCSYNSGEVSSQMHLYRDLESLLIIGDADNVTSTKTYRGIWGLTNDTTFYFESLEESEDFAVFNIKFIDRIDDRYNSFTAIDSVRGPMSCGIGHLFN